jgi:hypothetical protein
MIDEPSVVRSNGTGEVLARAVNLLIARGAFREAARMYPDSLVCIDNVRVAMRFPTRRNAPATANGPPSRGGTSARRAAKTCRMSRDAFLGLRTAQGA